MVDYRTYSDAELAECMAQIDAVLTDRRAIATESQFVAIHEQAAAESLAAAQRVKANATEARKRQNLEES